MDDLTKHFGTLCDKAVLNKLMSEADVDKDGRISVEDFMTMMRQYVDEHEVRMKEILQDQCA